MDIQELKQLIIKALDLYDRNNLKYYEYINCNNVIFKNNIEFHLNDNDKKSAEYEIIGYYDVTNSIWIWGWLLQVKYNDTELSRELLMYGLKLDPSIINAEQLYLKNLLLNSRFIVNDKIQLEINLAIFSYLLKKKFLFIYPKKIYSSDNKNYIIMYYFIKDFI